MTVKLVEDITFSCLLNPDYKSKDPRCTKFLLLSLRQVLEGENGVVWLGLNLGVGGKDRLLGGGHWSGLKTSIFVLLYMNLLSNNGQVF
jgi:hypothetical protein